MPRTAPSRPIRPLQRGDTIGVIAPGGYVERDALETGSSHLRALGYRVEWQPSILDRDLYFAGSVQRRADEIHEMFRRDDVHAIIAARGGYGCAPLLPLLDLDLILANAKILVGYSDLTVLHTWLAHHGMTTFHGPMVAKDFVQASGIDMESFRSVLGGVEYAWERPVGASVQTACGGSAEGRLYGGCLSLLVSTLGTPYEIHTDGTILYIEDIGVWPYQVDRMLTQLKLAGKFDGVRGVVFGDMAAIAQENAPGYTVAEIARRTFSNMNIPVAIGIPSGHVDRDNVTLPIGGQVRLTASASSVRLGVAAWAQEQ